MEGAMLKGPRENTDVYYSIAEFIIQKSTSILPRPVCV